MTGIRNVPNAVAIVIFQLFVGLLLGITSVGSGSLVILSMLYLFRMTTQQIVGSNLVIALMMVIPAGLTLMTSCVSSHVVGARKPSLA